jgi:hypothetical protein
MEKNELLPFEKTLLPCAFTVKSIITVHYFKYGQKFEFEGERHDFWEMLYVDRGQLTCQSGEGEFILKDGYSYERSYQYFDVNTDAEIEAKMAATHWTRDYDTTGITEISFSEAVSVLKEALDGETLTALKEEVATQLEASGSTDGKLTLTYDMTFVILLLGMTILRIPYGVFWAAGICLLDALPVLGTGTVLLPWGLILFLQGDRARAIGLLGVYTVIAVSRSVLEPRLVGRQLGLDPLMTLLSLYAGYRFLGFAGLLLAPILASATKSLFSAEEFRK